MGSSVHRWTSINIPLTPELMKPMNTATAGVLFLSSPALEYVKALMCHHIQCRRSSQWDVAAGPALCDDFRKASKPVRGQEVCHWGKEPHKRNRRGGRTQDRGIMCSVRSSPRKTADGGWEYNGYYFITAWNKG